MEAVQKSMIENYIHSYNSFDVEGMLKDLDQSVIFENISSGKISLKTEGISAFREQAETAKSYFKERNQSITNWEFTDGKVIVSIDYQGVLAVTLPNGLKAGDTLRLQGKSVFYFVKDKIVKIQDES